ncbi:MAG: spermidine/putrescine ABC transporter substrate-binding protein [Synechococcales bacterium]|nr:spermidine/putrescine ABC transporter substrate-binding protein [Synechococcales bacterium]
MKLQGNPKGRLTGKPRWSRRRFLQYSGLGLSGMALTSCGWRLGDTRANAKVTQGDPRQLYIYTWSGYIDDELLASFQSETGRTNTIQVVFPSNEVMLASFQAGKANTYSIIYPSSYVVQKMVKKDYLIELDHSRIPNLDNLFPQFRQSPSDPNNRYSVPVVWGTTGLIYNPAKVPEPPQDWDFLWKYKDKLTRRMSLLEDAREVMGATLKMMGDSYNPTDLEKIRQAYEKLESLKPAITNFSTDAWRDPLVAGDLWVAMAYSSDAAAIVQQNPKLRYVIPQGGTSLWSDNLVIPKQAPNPDAAYEWITFTLQPTVAAGLVQRLSVATPNRAAIELLSPELRDNPLLFPPQSVLDRCETIAPLTPELTELVERYWTKLIS